MKRRVKAEWRTSSNDTICTFLPASESIPAPGLLIEQFGYSKKSDFCSAG